MKYYSRSNMYKASNVSFNPATNIALSYDWYQLTRVINGTMILNKYVYSNSTAKHVYKVRQLLADLGRPVHLVIEAPKGLQDLGAAISHYESMIQNLEAQIAKPRSQAAKNAERRHEISLHTRTIKQIKELLNYEQSIYGTEKGA